MAERRDFRYTKMMSGNAINGAKGGGLSFGNYPKRQETPEQKKKDESAKRVEAKRKETRARVAGLGEHIDLDA